MRVVRASAGLCCRFILTGSIALDLIAGQVPLWAQSDPAVVYLDSLRQTIRGFGAANIRAWRPDMTSDNITKAFGTGDGQIGFSLLRLRLPSSTEEFAMNLPTAQAAYGMGAKLIASPWSPPAALKSNNNIVGGRLNDTSYAAYAAHIRSFVDYMAANGAPVYAVSVQNEPDITVTYESCDWNAAEMTKFVRDHGDTLGTRVIAPESFNFNKTISNAILNDSAAAANFAIVGGHIYGGGLASYPLAADMGKELWMTEHLELDTSWTAVLGTGREIQDCMSAGMNAYIWWYIIRYYGPIHEDGFVTKRGFVMSQFARFVRPGAVRMLTYQPRGAVPMTAYRRGSTITVVLVNAGTAVQQAIRFESPVTPPGSGGQMTVTPYVTSPTKNCVPGAAFGVSTGEFTIDLDSSSVTTLVCQVVTDVEEHGSLIPESVELGQNYPNPFNPSTTIPFALPVRSRVMMTVFDLLGREVSRIVDGEWEAGRHVAVWRPDAGSSGLYLCRLEARSVQEPLQRFVETRRMLLIR